MKILARLRVLILATLTPVAVFGLGGAVLLMQKERQTLERGLRDQARALMTAVDAQLYASITPLEVLALSPSLDRGDLAAFRVEAERAMRARSGEWGNVLLSDPSTAESLVNLLIEPGAPLPAPADADTIREAARSRHATVSQIAIGPVLPRPLFAVRVPVMRNGAAKYVLSGVVVTPTIQKLLERQALPASYTAAVLDGNFRFAARQPPPAPGVEFASESLRKALETSPGGWQRGRLTDGSEIYRAFHRSSLSRWSTAIAVPRAVVEQGIYAIWLLFAGAAIAAALGLGIAWWLALRISRPVAALAAAAPALGRGEAAALPPPGPLLEIRELAQALGDSARAIRDREERQRLAEQALRAADRAKDEFLAMLGHELRNPLASVSNAAQILKLSPHPSPLLRNVSEILARQVDHMTHLVDDLLEVGRITGGKIRLEREPLDLARSVGAVLEAWQAAGRFRHHQLHADLQPAWVSADRSRIEQVVINLLDNALKYTPAGGTIRVAVGRKGAEAALEVSDTGEGMSPELVGRVFDLFVQGERSLAREPGGLGIGLTMVKRLVELHDGTVSAASSGPAQGATFTVVLPAIEAPGVPQEHARQAPAAFAAQRVLVIEDNDDARESLAALLGLAGHEVHEAANGLQGIEMAKALAPALTLVDVGLPDIDGYEVAHRLRADPATRHLRLVALTGYGTQDDRRRALAAGFDEHLAKPVEPGLLEAMLDDRVAVLDPASNEA